MGSDDRGVYEKLLYVPFLNQQKKDRKGQARMKERAGEIGSQLRCPCLPGPEKMA
jgi:hypothetical protein